MSELIERYNEKLNCYECFDKKERFEVFKGLGDTPKEATVNYFTKFTIPNPYINIFMPCA
jgi:hypothetical protein